jgi:hypothetical protein
MTSLRPDWVEAIFHHPCWAHEHFFQSRHPDATPAFHAQVIEAWHSPRRIKLLVMAFRQGGKSTIGEEAMVLQAATRTFRNGVILGENQDRAMDRLTAIKHELINNEELIKIFGRLDGEVWGASKIILRNGVVIQALGRGQEVRGMKHLDLRPDLLFCDDLESKEHVRSPDARHETRQWFFSEVLPALDKGARIRLHATPLDRESLPVTIAGLPGWHSIKVPLKTIDGDGEWAPTWPSRYPLPWADAKEAELERLGLSHDFAREYMCEPEDPSKKVFTADLFKVVPRVHVWEPTYAFLDPARTTHARSSTTGWAVWSWVGDKLIVWDGGGGRWKPDEIVKRIFEINTQFRPIEIGVEKDGLDEFLLQPIRMEMVQRGMILPVKPMHAPDGKAQFIEALQPRFAAGAIEFAKPLPELAAQFLGFPTGQIDGPNALAYALRMRPGVPVYDDFDHQHVVETCVVWDDPPLWLAVNSNRRYTTGVLTQICDGAIHVLADWVREGDAGRSLHSIHDYARAEIGTNHKLRVVAGPAHFTGYDTLGVVPAIRRLAADPIQGGDLDGGRAVIRNLLQRNVRGVPMLQVAHAARWTLNGLAAGYCRQLGPRGQPAHEPEDNVYRVLIEGLESMAALVTRALEMDDEHQNWGYTETGERFKSIKPGLGRPPDTKSDWLRGPPPDRINGIKHFPQSLRNPRHGDSSDRGV